MVFADFAHDVVVPALARTRRHPLRQAIGVELIGAGGSEAGGHTNEIATLVLVPEVVDLDGPAR
jgi:NAD(P)H-dependent flavin oxidoreductase YrpB (nitropropane dioxygenase family)